MMAYVAAPGSCWQLPALQRRNNGRSKTTKNREMIFGIETPVKSKKGRITRKQTIVYEFKHPHQKSLPALQAIIHRLPCSFCRAIISMSSLRNSFASAGSDSGADLIAQSIAVWTCFLSVNRFVSFSLNFTSSTARVGLL